MGDWNASNILQNQGKANFSNMQQNQPPKQNTYDPFATLTSLGGSLPSQPQPRGQPTNINTQPRMHNPQGVSSSGAWGATFQTRPPAAQNTGGWNAGGNIQSSSRTCKNYF